MEAVLPLKTAIQALKTPTFGRVFTKYQEDSLVRPGPNGPTDPDPLI